MAISYNTIKQLSTWIILVLCCNYVIFFFTLVILKYKKNIKNFLITIIPVRGKSILETGALTSSLPSPAGQEDTNSLPKGQPEKNRINTDPNPSIDGIKKWWKPRSIPGVKQSFATIWAKDTRLGYFLEIIIITVWAIYVGRAYLNPDPMVWPTGLEFGSSVQTHYIWMNFFKCGPCVFWNGSTHGGAPAFADMQGSMLYPLVILSTLMMGVLNGIKGTLIAGLIMAGIAQWWLSKVMGFGRIPRLWSGLLAVVGGHLAARMELGVFGVFLSTAACSLVLAPGIALGLTGKRRYSIMLGITIGLALLAGQGYMQVGLIVGIIPAFLVFLPGRGQLFKNLWKEYLLAGFLAFLVAGVFLVPMIHFYPNVTKYEDPLFTVAQPLKYIPLNHLIDNVDFYNSTALKPTPYPVLYANFLGWVPILLAFAAWRFIPKSRLRLLLFFLVAILLVYLTASADLLKLLLKFLPLTAGVRNPPQIAGLANPLILGLSAWGLDALLRIKWPKLTLIGFNRVGTFVGNNIFSFFLAIMLIWSLKDAYVFGQNWLRVEIIDQPLYQYISYIKTSNSEWINLPFGRHFWLIPANDMSLKISNGFRTWSWKNRQDPPINQEVSSDPIDRATPTLIKVYNGLNYLSHFENEYATIQSGDQKIPCQAIATGGNIDVVCPESAKGQLIVYENNWTGWYAWVDQNRTPLLRSNWLSTAAPAGKHTYHFRYRPWDVWVGIFLTIFGFGLSTVLWFRAKQTHLPQNASSL